MAARTRMTYQSSQSDRRLKNIVVVGGGTAGWLSALYAKSVLPSSNVTVVESEDIGILGAGEGSTPQLIDFFDYVGIPISRLIKETASTIKSGIKFTNWKNDNNYYYHSFLVQNNLGFEGYRLHANSTSAPTSLIGSVIDSEDLSKSDYISKLSEQHKAPFQIRNNSSADSVDPIFRYHSDAVFSVHFDANKLASLLKDVALERGVHHVEGTVSSSVLDAYGDIKQLKLDGHSNTIDVDFIFDCTGFARVFIGKTFNANWKSHADKLPVNAAVPFFLPQDKKIPAYTESIAMKYGWMWKIPLQDRYGCGYVYDSSLISEKQAVEEIESYLGFEPKYPRKDKGGFKFSAGYYTEPWQKNCIAVGLASGFIEPLEATSIWVTIMTLQNALSNLEVMTSRDTRNADQFNKRFVEINNQIADFIYFHYMSNRTDTEFWKKFTVENAPERVKDILSTWEHRLPYYDQHQGELFGMQNWVSIAAGVERLNKNLITKSYNNSPALQEAHRRYKDLKRRQDFTVKNSVDHREFLEEVGNG
jgi:tryptophan halogenase